MTSDHLFALIFLLLVAFDVVLMVILAHKWVPRCQKCNGSNLKILNSYEETWEALRPMPWENLPHLPGSLPVKVCRGCGHWEVL